MLDNNQEINLQLTYPFLRIHLTNIYPENTFDFSYLDNLILLIHFIYVFKNIVIYLCFLFLKNVRAIQQITTYMKLLSYGKVSPTYKNKLKVNKNADHGYETSH